MIEHHLGGLLPRDMKPWSSYFLNGDVDPNRSDKHGVTPISYAAKEGQLLQVWEFVDTPDDGARREGEQDVRKSRDFFSLQKSEARPLVNECWNERRCPREER